MSKFNIQTEEELIKSKDGKIIFDEKEHIYYYQNESLISVTQFIKLYTPDFNSLFASNSKAKKNKKSNIENGNNNEITNPIELRKYWKLTSERSTNLGTAAHIFSQLYCMNKNTEAKSKYEEAVIKAINDIEKYWEIIEQEDIVYNLDYKIAGSIDLILRHKKTKEYWIADWKTTEDMHKGYGKLLEEFKEFPNNSLYKYSIQLDLYSLMSNYYIPHNNKMIIQLKNTGEFVYYTPTLVNDLFKLPYTYNKTKEALDKYKVKKLI